MTLYAKTFEQLSGAQVYEILKARAAVFTMEQEIRYPDMDDIDYRSVHCFFERDGKVVAYLRAFAEETAHCFHVGRVLTTVRGAGLRRQLLEQSLQVLRERYGCRKVVLHSQTGAAGFYEKVGFHTVGGVFTEAGIPHVKMEREL